MTRERGSLAQSRRNWREWPGPLGDKLRLWATNNWRKVRRFDSCCGNSGEPGC